MDKLFKLIKSDNFDQFIKTLEQYKKSNLDIDINDRDELNNYLITYAIVKNNIKSIKAILDWKCRLDIIDNDNKTILFDIIRYDKQDILDLLLDYDKNNIGISLLNYTDINGMSALHYAVIFNNINAVRTLLRYNCNPDLLNKNKNNALHLGIYKQNYEICKLLLSSSININKQTKTGETALHLSLNFNMNQLFTDLINLGADYSILDYDHEFAPIHYAVTLDNLDAFKLLVDKGADINQQDILGHTPLYYICMMNRIEFMKYLVRYHKGEINVNINNYEGKTPLHIVLIYNFIDNIYLDYLIKYTNLNIQDNLGNTCMHYMISADNIWIKYEDILKTKKINIYIKNNRGNSLFDILEKKYHDKFLNLIIDSYYYLLVNNKKNYIWNEDWENKCSLLKSGENICKKEIRKKLIKLYDSKKKSCKTRSYPVKKDKKCITIEYYKGISICTFTGSVLDIVFGLIYLLKKHKITSSPINPEIFITGSGLGEHLELEIEWVDGVLYAADDFITMFEKLSKKYRFMIMPLGIQDKTNSHANYIVYDSKTKEFERFEPYGSNGPYGFNYNQYLLDIALERMFDRIQPVHKYIKPKDYLPRIGFQYIETSESYNDFIGDPRGFCALWSIWYVDQRLTYPDVDRGLLIKKLIKSVRTNNILFKKLIRDYSKNITNIRDDFLKKANVNINDWININMNNDQINILSMELYNILKKIII